MPVIDGVSLTDDEVRELEESRSVQQQVDDFTRGNDPNPGGRFPGGSYKTPDEARAAGEAWVARPGEPQDLTDPYHYQTQDESTALGRDWASQPAIRSGNAVHAGFTPGMSLSEILARGRTTPDEINAWLASGGDPSMINPRGGPYNPVGGAAGAGGADMGGWYMPGGVAGMSGGVTISGIAGMPQAYRPFTEPFTWNPADIRGQQDYEFKRDEGMRGIERTASARGKSFTPDTRQALVDWNSSLASTEMGANFDRTRAMYLDKAGIHLSNEGNRFGTERSNVLDAWGRDDSLWNRDRTATNDQWARGTDVWSMGRTDRQDDFDNNFRLSDLILRQRPRPA